jgi:hypothetical protein
MTETKPVYRHTYKTFAEARGISIATTKRLVANGTIRSVLVTPKIRRLEDPADCQARQEQESMQ